MPMSIRRGYHRVILTSPDGDKVIEGPLVCLFDDRDNLLSWHKLHGEEPFVQWIGGTLKIEGV